VPYPSHKYLFPERTCLPSCPFLFFLKCILIVQGIFILVFQTCIYHALMWLSLHYLIFLYYPSPLLFNSVQCIVLCSYTDAKCFNVFHSVTFSFPLLPPHSIKVILITQDK
jgi:hypothetical protein